MRTSISSRTAALLTAVVVGFGVFTVGCIGDVLLLASSEDRWIALIDDSAIGAFAAVLVLYYEWRRNAQVRRKLRIIAEMNHHVRNQLEIIEYSAWETHDKAHIERMQRSVGHIEWALREILGHDQEDLPESPAAKPPASVPLAEIGAKHDSST